MITIFFTTLFKKYNHFNVCILILLLHMYDINRHLNFCCCCIPSRRWPKKVETCRRTSPYCTSMYQIIIRLLVYIYICVWWLILQHGIWIILNLKTHVLYKRS